MLSVQSISKSYLKGKNLLKALTDVSIDINEGDTCALLGPNGSGKSTLIKSVLGLLEVDDGSVFISGLPIANKIVNQNLGAIVEGQKSINERLTAIENARYFSVLRSGKFDVDYFHKLADCLDLKHSNKPVRFLSTGNKQKVSIISALIHKPSFVILDEPTLGMDNQCVESLKHLLKELTSSQGVTLLITSHDLYFVEKICDKLICLVNGEIKYQGQMREFISSKYQFLIKLPINNELTSLLKEQNVEIKVDANQIEVFIENLDSLIKIMELLKALNISEKHISISDFDLRTQYMELIK